MLFGVHVSIAGGVYNAPGFAAELGAECFQIFSRSPRGGKPMPLTKDVLASFQAELGKHKLHDFYIHTPYYINFASQNKKIRWGSVSVVREELERGTSLGAQAIMTHLGSARDYGRQVSIKKVYRAVHHVLEKYQGTTLFLLEQSAGAGGEDGIIGGSLDELAYIYKQAIKVNKAYKKYLGICVDTCHAFAMGYDLRDKKALDKYLKEFDQKIGLSKLKLIHANDSKFGLGEHKDRHEHIGKGKIGLAGFRALVNHPKLRNINVILETPQEGNWPKKNLAILKKLRKK